MTNPLFKESVDLIRVTFQGENILFVVTVAGIVYGAYRSLKKRLIKQQSILIKSETRAINKEQDKKIDLQQETMNQVIESLGSIERNLLRTQILMGMEQKLFSKSELSYFYDKYTNLGGNSFVSDKVEAYLKRTDIL